MTYEYYPSIESFQKLKKTVSLIESFNRHAAGIRDDFAPLPTMKFDYTVKLHGTNAGIHYSNENGFSFYSRSRQLALLSDNQGFCQYAIKKSVIDSLKFIIRGLGVWYHLNSISFHGEWCGEGIQNGVAINKLPKMFVIFGIRFYYTFDNEIKKAWLNPYLLLSLLPKSVIKSLNDERIFFSYQFPHGTIEIDMEHPEDAMKIIDEMVEAIDKECPVGKFFGVNGTGEGLVFTHFCKSGNVLQFKAKGASHSVVKKRTPSGVDTSKMNEAESFADNVLAEHRLMQGIEYLNQNNQPISEESTGPFIQWMIGDVFKEEQDVIVENNLDAKAVKTALAKKSREWFFKYIRDL